MKALQDAAADELAKQVEAHGPTTQDLFLLITNYRDKHPLKSIDEIIASLQEIGLVLAGIRDAVRKPAKRKARSAKPSS